MKLFKSISVRLKIVILITTISAFSVLISLIIILGTKIVESKNQFRADAILDTKLMGAYCIMPLEFNDSLKAKRLLQIRISRGDVNCASVYTREGKLFSIACNSDIEVPETILPEQSVLKFEANILHVIEPIIHEGAYSGLISMHYYTGLRASILRQVLIGLSILILIIIVSFILALRFQKFISRPILKLIRKISEVSEDQGYITKIKKTSNDEIGLLYDRFNQMLNAINLREDELDKAIKALSVSEEKFRNIFNFSLDGIVVTDMNSNILEASAMLGEIFNISLEKMKGMKMIDILPPSYMRQRNIVLTELEKKGEFKFVTNYPVKGKADVYLEFSSKIINQDGKKAILSLVSNITKRIKAEEALKESEERYKKLVENFPSAIVLHRNEEIVFVNDIITTTLAGATKHEFIGRQILDFFPKKSKETILTHFRSVDEVNRSAPTIEVKMNKLNGEEIDVEISSIPLIFNKKKTVLSVFKDISSRKMIEDKLVIALKQAEESDTLKSAFLANMSHEIRTPMNGVIGFADLLSKEDIQKEDIDRYVDIIKSSSDKLLAIINDIIDISKIESGAINVNKEVFDFSILIDEIYQFFLPQTEKKGLELILDQKSRVPILLNSDRSKIGQIITNLLSNAVKFTKEGSVKISYYISKEGDILKLEVKDTGIGIPTGQLDTIFERFHQTDQYLHDFKEGTGLGLSICKGYAQALDGKIWVDPESNKGALFHLELPVNQKMKKSKEQKEVSEDSNALGLKNKNILIVEDEKYNYLYLKELLEQKGAHILWADDGLKAIQFVLSNPDIDFVLMDIKLPIMDGFTAARKIKSYRKKLPIVAQTAFALEGDKEKTIAAGLDDYLAKPIKKDELFSMIEKYITN